MQYVSKLRVHNASEGIWSEVEQKGHPYKKATTNPEVMLDGSLIWIIYLDQNNIGNETLICAGTYKWFLYWNLYGVCFVCSPFHNDNNNHFRVTVFICIITSVLLSSRGTIAAYMFTRISFITEYDSNLCRGNTKHTLQINDGFKSWK